MCVKGRRCLRRRKKKNQCRNTNTHTPTHTHTKKKKMNTLDRVRFKSAGKKCSYEGCLHYTTIKKRFDIKERIRWLQDNINKYKVSGEMEKTGSWGFLEPKERLKTYHYIDKLDPHANEFHADRVLDEFKGVLERNKFHESEGSHEMIKGGLLEAIEDLKKEAKEMDLMQSGYDKWGQSIDTRQSKDTDRETAEYLMMLGSG